MKKHNLCIVIISALLITFVPVFCQSAFVDISEINPRIVFDLRYAAEYNFFKKAVYPIARCYVLCDLALRLDSIEQHLAKKGSGLKIFDGYFPLSVQKKMREIFPDSQYGANPKNGSRHNRGPAEAIKNRMAAPRSKKLSGLPGYRSFIYRNRQFE